MNEKKVRERRWVVGVDGSAASESALAWAVEHAREAGATVDVVMAWQPPITYGWAVYTVGENLARWAAEALDRSVVRAVGPHPPVRIHKVVQCGEATDVLVRQTVGADLLVVGSHRQGRVVQALLGSVSKGCVESATCPVRVVRCTSLEEEAT